MRFLNGNGAVVQEKSVMDLYADFARSDESSEPRAIRRIAPKVARSTLPHTAPVQARSGSTAVETLRAVRPITARTRTFSDDMVLYFHVAGYPEPLRIRPYHTPMIIGRYAPESSVMPDINLEPYGAAQSGMSRLHAELCRRDNTLVISDMNSVNHTYVNGEELSSKEARGLRDGDELRFGTLVVRVQFGTDKNA